MVILAHNIILEIQPEVRLLSNNEESNIRLTFRTYRLNTPLANTLIVEEHLHQGTSLSAM